MKRGHTFGLSLENLTWSYWLFQPNYLSLQRADVPVAQIVFYLYKQGKKRKNDSHSKKPLLLRPLSFKFSDALLCPFAFTEQSVPWTARSLPTSVGCCDVLNFHVLLPTQAITSNCIHSFHISALYSLLNKGMLLHKVGAKCHSVHTLPPNKCKNRVEWKTYFPCFL